MEAVFLKLFNMSIAASFMILAVVLLRALLRKAPKALRCLLWALVGIRLICPFSIESVLSLIPSTQTIPETVLSEPSFSVQTGFEGIDTRVNAELASRYYEGVTVPTNTGLHAATLISAIWVIGIFALAIYAVVSFIKLRKQTAEAVPYRENIYLCDRIPAPFILGVVKPRIFLPATIGEAEIPYVLAHEQAHLKRRDHLWKPLGFVLLSIYWFNPLIWVAYILLCRDIELACDEKVIKAMGTECKKPYANALIRCSVSQKRLSACPVAFGETDVKNRIQSVLHYKKPAFWVLLTAVLGCIAVAVCFLTAPKGMLLTELGTVSGEPQSVTVNIEGKAYKVASNIMIDYMCDFLDEVYVSTTPITHSRSEERDKTNTVIFHFDSGDICYYFNGDCTELWIYDNIKPSLTHRVKNPQAVRQFLKDGVWNAGPVPSSGVFLEITEAEFAGENPYIEIKWVNSSEKNLIFGEAFSIIRITKSGWEPYSFPENYGFNAVGILLPANSFRVQRYSLKGLNITPGTYLFESKCTDNDSEIAPEERQDYSVVRAFDLTENADEKLVCTAVSGDPYRDTAYVFHDSVDWMEPNFTLSPHTQQFQFTLSAFSSYWPHGTYELTDGTLTMRTDDGKNVYVFHAQGKDFVFDAAQSSPIPQYKYAADATETQSPVPDGAVFAFEPSA